MSDPIPFSSLAGKKLERIKSKGLLFRVIADREQKLITKIAIWPKLKVK
jgi:hypothetical protein